MRFLNLSLQEIFNRAYLGLAAQGFERSTAPGRNNTPGCSYRGDDGRKCAAGHLMDDDEYHSNMEGRSIQSILNEHPICNKLDMVGRLQRAHDNSNTPQDMRENLARAAESYGVTVPAIPETP